MAHFDSTKTFRTTFPAGTTAEQMKASEAGMREFMKDPALIQVVTDAANAHAKAHGLATPMAIEVLSVDKVVHHP